jgi:hypothetical protein
VSSNRQARCEQRSVERADTANWEPVGCEWITAWKPAARIACCVLQQGLTNERVCCKSSKAPFHAGGLNQLTLSPAVVLFMAYVSDLQSRLALWGTYGRPLLGATSSITQCTVQGQCVKPPEAADNRHSVDSIQVQTTETTPMSLVAP